MIETGKTYRCTVPGMASPTLCEKDTLVRRLDFSTRNVSRIFACCSLDNAAGGPDFASSLAVLGAMREFGGSDDCALPPCSAAWGLATDGAWAVSAGFSFVGACAVGAGFSFIGACAVGAGFSFAGACAVGAGFSFMGACAFGAGDFCGRVLGCWSILPPGAFGSWAAAPGASRFSPVPCAEPKPVPAMSAAVATVTSKVFLMVFFIEISNKSDCYSVTTRQIVFMFQVFAKIYTV